MTPILLLLSIPGTSTARFLTETDILVSASCQPEDVVFSIPVEGYPDSLLPDGATDLDLIPVRAGDTVELVAGARMDGGWLALDTLVFNGSWNDAKSWAWWDDEASGVVLASQLPFRMYTWMTIWSTDGRAFDFVSEWDEDASRDALEETLALLDSGRVEEASEQLFFVLYPGWYFGGEEMAARFLGASRREAERRIASGDTDGALAVYLCAGDAYQQCGLDSVWFLDSRALGDEGNPIAPWMEDAELAGILDHLSMVAGAAGDGVVSSRAAEAARVLDPAME
jgi:hypothetical protein